MRIARQVEWELCVIQIETKYPNYNINANIKLIHSVVLINIANAKAALSVIKGNLGALLWCLFL